MQLWMLAIGISFFFALLIAWARWTLNSGLKLFPFSKQRHQKYSRCSSMKWNQFFISKTKYSSNRFHARVLVIPKKTLTRHWPERLSTELAFTTSNTMYLRPTCVKPHHKLYLVTEEITLFLFFLLIINKTNVLT